MRLEKKRKDCLLIRGMGHFLRQKGEKMCVGMGSFVALVVGR